jgi:hypothetical protein
VQLFVFTKQADLHIVQNLSNQQFWRFLCLTNRVKSINLIIEGNWNRFTYSKLERFQIDHNGAVRSISGTEIRQKRV